MVAYLASAHVELGYSNIGTTQPKKGEKIIIFAPTHELIDSTDNSNYEHLFSGF